MISLIVAFDPEKTMGLNGELPWHFKEDLAYFKRITKNHTCVMGRLTYQSIIKKIGKPLPERENIVVSTKLNDSRVTVITDFESFLKTHAETENEVFVIGGKRIYETALPYAKRLYITHIHEIYQGDVKFPEIDYYDFTRIFYDPKEALSFAIYERTGR